MATVAENLTRIQNAIGDIKDAIIAKGGTISSTDKIDDLADKINDLPTSGGSDKPDIVFYDWCQGNANAWIETEYVIDFTNTSIDCVFLGSVTGTICGTRETVSSAKFALLMINSTTFRFNAQETYKDYTIANNTINYAKLYNKKRYLFNNAASGIISTNKNETNSYHMAIFNAVTGGVLTNGWPGKIYSLVITENGKLIHNFCPCTYNNVAGMFDTVNERFYGSSGTEPLVVGNN